MDSARAFFQGINFRAASPKLCQIFRSFCLGLNLFCVLIVNVINPLTELLNRTVNVHKGDISSVFFLSIGTIAFVEIVILLLKFRCDIPIIVGSDSGALLVSLVSQSRTLINYFILDTNLTTIQQRDQESLSKLISINALTFKVADEKIATHQNEDTCFACKPNPKGSKKSGIRIAVDGRIQEFQRQKGRQQLIRRDSRQIPSSVPKGSAISRKQVTSTSTMSARHSSTTTSSVNTSLNSMVTVYTLSSTSLDFDDQYEVQTKEHHNQYQYQYHQKITRKGGKVCGDRKDEHEEDLSETSRRQISRPIFTRTDSSNSDCSYGSIESSLELISASPITPTSKLQHMIKEKQHHGTIRPKLKKF